jgi:putative addiction module component (TIGR02574 family)
MIDSVKAADVKVLTFKEKVQIMEAIWEDFRGRFDRMEISDEQRILLDSRRERVRTGSATVRDWDSVKTSIGRA